MTTYLAENVTDTSLTFTALLPPDAGVYDVLLKDAGGLELAREADGIEVTPAVIRTITAISPNNVTAGTWLFTVTGSGLAATTTAGALDSTTGLGLTDYAVTEVSDASFKFTANLQPGTYHVLALEGGTEKARLSGGLTLTVPVAANGDIVSWTPVDVAPGVVEHFIIDGFGLQKATHAWFKINGTVDWVQGPPVVHTSAYRYEFDHSLTAGLWDMAAFDGNVNLASKDAAITCQALTRGDAR